MRSSEMLRVFTHAIRVRENLGGVSMKNALIVPAVALVLGVASCTNPYDPGQRAVGGGLLGAGAGAAIGAAAGGGTGAAIGAATGGALGAITGAATTPPPPQYPPPGYHRRDTHRRDTHRRHTIGKMNYR